MKYTIAAPKTPGAAPATIGKANTIREARRIAANFSEHRSDLTYSDVRIDVTKTGVLKEYAGPNH